MGKDIYKRKNKALKITLIVIKNICLALLITLVFAFATGFKFLNILTGSMTPTMPKDTVIIIKKIPISQVEIGDVITFKMGDSNVTHRVVDIKGNGNHIALVTRGDAADGNDQNVTVENPVNPAQNKFVGVVIFHIPYLGVLLNLIKDNIIIITVCIVLALFIITYS